MKPICPSPSIPTPAAAPNAPYPAIQVPLRLFVGQVGNLRPIGNRPASVGQPILAEAAFQAASSLQSNFRLHTVNPLLALLLLSLPASAAIDGTVVNRTTGQPQSNVAITVSKMNAGTGMLSDNAGSAKSDAQGKFAFPTSVDGPTLLRASWDGVTYSHMLPPGTPSSGITVEVFNSSKTPGASKVDKHMLLFEPAAGEMTVNETFLVKNDGATTWNDPKDGTLHFYLPASHTKFQIHATAPGSVDVPTTAAKSAKPDIYKVDFAIKPGETRFDIAYNVPYTIGAQYEGKIVTKDDNTYLIVPDGVTLAAENVTDLGQEPRTKAHIYGLAGATYNIQLSGAEVAPPADANTPDTTQDPNSGPQIEATMPRVFDQVKPILAIALGILGLGFALLYRKEANGGSR
jgi:hypothetical protein